MSWKATAYVKGLKVAPNGERVTRSEKLYLFVLADSHNEDRRAAWPSVPKIAQGALLSERRVREIANACRLKGLICWDEQSKENGGTESNLYHFCKLDCDHEPMQRATLPQRPGGRPPGKGVKKSQGGEGEEIASGGAAMSAGGPDELIPSSSPCDASAPPDAKLLSRGDAASRNCSFNEPQVQPPSEPTHTHHGELLPFQAPEGDTGVCVSRRLTVEDYLRFARSQPSFHTPDAWVSKHYGSMAAEALVREWLEGQTPEKIAEVRATPPDNSMTYFEAEAHLRSILSLGAGHDAAACIERLNVSEEVRERLTAKFITNGTEEAGA